MFSLAKTRHFDTMKKVDFNWDVNMKDEGGYSVLHWAALSGDLAAAKWLLEMGSDSDPQGDNLQTPLFWACTRGNFDTVLLLLSKGENGEPLADINHKDSVGATPVMIAIQFLNCNATVAHTIDRQIKATEMVRVDDLFDPAGRGTGPKNVPKSFGKISAKFRSFSAVSVPISATKYAFCSIFQNLPDYLPEIFEIWHHFVNFAT